MTSENTFASLGLAEPLLRALADKGYSTPTPIQSQAIPLVLEGGDLLAAAQTGTGKTAGFTLPILHRLHTHPIQAKAGRPRCLILTPTRELAAQVEESVQTYGKHLPLRSMVMFGGVGINPQIAGLRKPLDILVATPGRLLDHVGQKTVDLSGVETLVLDEADRMLDMGFIRDIRKILALLPKKRQNLLFSATFSDEIRELADGLLHEPGFVEVARRNTASELVDQSVHLIAQKQKRHLLAHLIKTRQWFQVLVFTRTKHGANRLAEQLGKDGIGAAAIHGNKSQGARTRALADFKSGDLQVLVATDIAARGLDIDQLPQVVNFELPNVPEDYVHRIGRTGRAGATGAAVSLVDPEEMRLLGAIEKLTKRPIPRVKVEDFVPQAVTAESGSDERVIRTQAERGRTPRGHNAGEARENRAPAERREGRAGGSGKPAPRNGQAAPRSGQAAPRNGNAQANPRSAQGARPDTRSGKPAAGTPAKRPAPQGAARRPHAEAPHTAAAAAPATAPERREGGGVLRRVAALFSGKGNNKD